MSRPTEKPRLRPAIVFGLVGLAASSVAFLMEAPAFAGFGVAVLAAANWCLWLEENPEDGNSETRNSELGIKNSIPNS